jgi:hypothetical protein
MGVAFVRVHGASFLKRGYIVRFIGTVRLWCPLIDLPSPRSFLPTASLLLICPCVRTLFHVVCSTFSTIVRIGFAQRVDW